MTRTRLLLWTGGLTLAALAVTRVGADGIPTGETMFYSGVLEEDGAPVDGTRNVEVRFFDDAAAGTERCNTSATVAFDDGRFRVPLNAGCTDAVRAEPDLWVQIQIGTDAPFPRTKLGAVPYAVEAGSAAAASGGLRSELDAREATLGSLASRVSALEAVTNVEMAIAQTSNPFESTTSTTPVTIPGLEVTIDTDGAPVLLALQGNGGVESDVRCFRPAAGGCRSLISFVRDGSLISTQVLSPSNVSSGFAGTSVPASAFTHLDHPPAGTHQYSVRYQAGGSGMEAQVEHVELVVRELPVDP